MFLDDGEGAEDVAGFVPREAVEMEVECVEAGPQVPALLFVPDERRAGVAEPPVRSESPGFCGVMMRRRTLFRRLPVAVHLPHQTVISINRHARTAVG